VTGIQGPPGAPGGSAGTSKFCAILFSTVLYKVQTPLLVVADLFQNRQQIHNKVHIKSEANNTRHVKMLYNSLYDLLSNKSVIN